MKEKRECKIINDLLPNYIDGLTTEETNTYVEEHLKECEQCRNILRNMKQEININRPSKDSREVKYIKKYNKKLKILKVILLIIFALFIVKTGRNMIILKNLSNKAEKYVTSSNYHKIVTTYNGNSIITMEAYYKNGKSVGILKSLNNESEFEQIIYSNGKDDKVNVYRTIDGKKEVELNANNNFAIVRMGEIYISTENALEFIISSITSNIKSSNCNGKQCYFMSGIISSNMLLENNMGFYIDKENGLVVRYTDTQSTDEAGYVTDSVVDYRYEFNNVNDDIFEEPDISQYQIKK